MGTHHDGRPSWLTTPCPDWCEAEHEETDHVQDRLHRATATEVAAVLGRVDDASLRVSADAATIVVQRRQHVDDRQDWILVSEADDTSRSLLISPESARRLIDALESQVK